MINAKELRIDNWFYIGEMIGRCNADSFKDTTIFDPIPLTEEWLFNLGFEKSTDNYGGYLSPKFNGERIRISQYNTWDNGCFVSVFNYVHQLQNLWHSLTGTELTYTQTNK